MAKFISGNWIMGLFVSYVWIGGGCDRCCSFGGWV